MAASPEKDFNVKIIVAHSLPNDVLKTRQLESLVETGPFLFHSG